MNSEFDVHVAYLNVNEYSSRISLNRPVLIHKDYSPKFAFLENKWNKCKKRSNRKPKELCDK
jgi:hypothetical protein